MICPEEIRRFLSECQNSKELIQVAAHHRGAFCYFQDYLIKRLEPWRVLDFVQVRLDGGVNMAKFQYVWSPLR